MSRLPSFLVQSPTTIEFGVGIVSAVGERASGLGMRHVFLICDAVLAKLPPVLDTAAALERAGVAVTVFDQVELDPTSASITAAVRAYRESSADGLVAVGGGSAMDTAKALGVLAMAGSDDVSRYFFGGPEAITGMTPLICVPTTAGTGSEVTWISVVTHQQQKQVLRDPRIAPALALIDPALMLSMPPALTASTGLDALSHALETLFSSRTNPYSDALALDATMRIVRYLPRAVSHGDDLEARTELAAAATLAGLAFLNSRLHLGHAVGHSLGTHFKLSHGFACAVCLPAIVDFVAPTRPEMLTQLGVVFGDSDVPAAISRLMDAIEAPRVAAATGVGADRIDQLVELVESEQRLIALSPRRPNREDWRRMFAASM